MLPLLIRQQQFSLSSGVVGGTFQNHSLNEYPELSDIRNAEEGHQRIAGILLRQHNTRSIII